MDLFTVFKSPLVLIVLAGSVVITNVVTYIVATPAQVDCRAAVEEALAENKMVLEEIRHRQAEDDADLDRARRPAEGLNPNREGGVNWNDSIR